MAHDDDCVTRFLETGHFGPLNLGMPRQEIVRSIGEPNDVGCTRKRRPHENCVYLYGETDKVNLQLAISEGNLTGNWLYFRGRDDTSSLPDWTTPETCPLKGSMPLNNFFAVADRLGLPWRICDSWTMEDQTTLIVPPAGVLLIWGHDPDSLYAAMLTA
jgi:hypothetical protein